MNKLFTRIGVAFVGIAMAIGVGVAVGSNRSERVNAGTIEVVTYSLDGTVTGGSSGYGTESDITQSNLSWKVEGNTTQNPWRIGGNSLNGVDRVAYSTGTISDTITKVELTVGTASSITVNSLKLIVASNSTFSTVIEEVSETFSASSTITFDSSKTWSNCYYKFVFNVSVTGSTNRYLQFKGADFYKETQESPLTGLSVNNLSLYPGRTGQLTVSPVPNDAVLPNDLTYTSSNTGIATVSNTGLVTAVAAGSCSITVNSPSKSKSTTSSITVTEYPDSVLTSGSYAIIGNVPQGNYEMTGVSGGYGTCTEYNIKPACSNPVTIESTNYGKAVALKLGDEYLEFHGSDSKLYTSDTKSINSSWVILYDNTNGYTVYWAQTYDPNNANTRLIRFNYNNGNPRFAAYASISESTSTISFFSTEVIALTDFSLSDARVGKGETISVPMTLTPENATDLDGFTWTSSNNSIATVTDGAVTGVAVGTVTITGKKTISGNEVSRTCSVEVYNTVAAHQGTEVDPFSINDAVNIAKGDIVKVKDGTAYNKNNAYYVKGIITASISATTTNLSFWAGDNAEQVSAVTGGFEFYKIGKIGETDLATAYDTDQKVADHFPVGATIVASGKITLYKGTPEFSQGGDVAYNSYAEAEEYAQAFNTAVSAVCDDQGATTLSSLKAAWKSQAQAFAALEDVEKAHLVAAVANESGTDIQKFAAKYDYVAGKYQTQLEQEGVADYDFAGRNPSQINGRLQIYASSQGNNPVILIVALLSVVTLVAIGGCLILKKKGR